jgi:hypothetical protein
VGLAVAAGALQVHGPLHAVHAGVADGVARLDGAPVDPHPPAGELQHLGHERQPLEPALLVEGGEDLLLAADLDQLADAQAEPFALRRPVRPDAVGAHSHRPFAAVAGSRVTVAAADRLAQLPHAVGAATAASPAGAPGRR